MSATAVLLLGALLIAHDLGDFTPLATARIQQAKATGRPVMLIALHAAIHAVLVALAVTLVIQPPLAITGMAAGFELATHFAIDLFRARVGVRIPPLGDMRANPFWWILGVDQLLHGLVLVGIAFLVLA